MEPEHARVHALHELDHAAGISRALQSDIRELRTIIVEALSVDYPHVAREKCDVLATFYIPRRTDAIRDRIRDVRELLLQL